MMTTSETVVPLTRTEARKMQTGRKLRAPFVTEGVATGRHM